MKHRKREPVDAPETPDPEPQGDGEPAPEDAFDASDGVSAPAATEASPGTNVDAALAEQHEKYLRLAAEFDNYRKRTTRERLEAGTRGQGELILRLLEVIDDITRFADIDPATTDTATLHKGIELVEQKLLKSLGAVGLEVINPQDQSFDPNLHEAITTEPALSPEDDHTVSKVFQLGYRFGGQLLRPARVVVKQWAG